MYKTSTVKLHYLLQFGEAIYRLQGCCSCTGVTHRFYHMGGLSCHCVARNQHRTDICHLLDATVNDIPAEAIGVPVWYGSVVKVKDAGPSPRVTTLIDWSSDHEGAGSFIVDDAISGSTADALIELWKTIPTETELIKKKKTGPCSVRSYYCDAILWVATLLSEALSKSTLLDDDGNQIPNFSSVLVYPHMRFLCYSISGIVLAPHTDLSRLDANSGKRSTHSFLLYLTDCDRGGATALIGATGGEQRNQVLATVQPKRGRLLLFPHQCPHEGLEVVDVPKLLIRGEVWLPGSKQQD